jgi:hypothetical protein
LAGIGLLVLFVAAAPARAATVLSTWDFSVDGLGDFTLAGALDRFEPARGTLQKVCLGMTGEAGVELEFNRLGNAADNQIFSATAKLRGGELGMSGDNTIRSLVTVPASPDRGSRSATSTISARAEFTPQEWREFVSGFGPGHTLEFSVDGSLTANVNGAKTYDQDVLGQPLDNQLRGRFFVRYIFDADVVGDANGDGWVNLGDFGIVKSSFGAQGEDAELGDLTGDGLVDLNDFGQLKISMARAAGATPVPEPAGIVLALAGFGALALSALAKRSRRRTA